MRVAIVNHATNQGPGPIIEAGPLQQLVAALGQYADLVGIEHDIVIGEVTLADVCPDNAWELGIFDDSDTAGALGYHDTDPNGQPYAKVFRNDCSDFGTSPWGLAAVASHELAEMMRDPYAQWWTDRGTYEEALELCDRVEGTSFLIDGLQMSNFLLASALDPTATSGPWDFCKVLGSQTEITPDGYAITRSTSYSPALGAYLKVDVRGKKGFERRRWATKTTVGRTGKRLGLYASDVRCPVCRTPLSNRDHMRRPCTVPDVPKPSIAIPTPKIVSSQS